MKKKYLNLACGKLHQKSTDDIEWVNLDISSEVKPDIVCDMRKGLPFLDDEIDHIDAIACLGQIESNKDFLFVMNELWRVLKKEGTIFIYLPHKDFDHAWIDPFNQRRFNESSWECFNEKHSQYLNHNHYYGFKPWKNVKVFTNEKGFLDIKMTVSK